MELLKIGEGGQALPRPLVEGAEGFVAQAFFNQPVKVLVAHRIALNLERKAVAQRAQFGEFGNFVGRPEQHDHAHRLGPAILIKFALVDNRQQGIKDRRVGFENFVEKHHGGGRQFALDPAEIGAFLESSDVHRADDLAGFGKLGQHVLEILALAQIHGLAELDVQV